MSTAITRTHPYRSRWLEDEARMRASYLATRRHLAPFLVPHRFEGKEVKDVTQLRRAKYGYGIQLNRAYLQEIFGHLRDATVTYTWGPLATGGTSAEPTSAAPTDGVAKALWDDFTRDGVSLRNFIDGTVLEWLCSSVGGFIVLDIPSTKTISKADEQVVGKRPYGKFVPWSAVEDFGIGPTGFRWMRLRESVDTREPDGTGSMGDQFVVYRLTGDGVTVQREDKDGNVVGEPIELGTLVDVQGNSTLPIVPVKIGDHPDVPALGTGLLFGLDDIVIDLFNVVSEVREGYRDAAFGLLVHTGPDPDSVAQKLADGSRLISLGDSKDAKLERLAAESSEVETGLRLIELGVKNWALSAKRQAAEAMQQQAAEARSGVSLQAEFALDLKPLLVTIAETLDLIEVNVLFLAAQLAGSKVERADTITVTRNTEFRLEDEASRIARIVTEFVDSALPFPAEARTRLAVRWLEATDLLDLAAKAGAGEGTTDGEAGQTVRDVVERQARDLAEAAQTRVVNLDRMPAAGQPAGQAPGGDAAAAGLPPLPALR